MNVVRREATNEKWLGEISRKDTARSAVISPREFSITFPIRVLLNIASISKKKKKKKKEKKEKKEKQSELNSATALQESAARGVGKQWARTRRLLLMVLGKNVARKLRRIPGENGRRTDAFRREA